MAGFRTQPWGVPELLLSLESCRLVLPEFQRDFVWNPKDINLLLVSLAAGHPAGSLLFLRRGDNGGLGWRPVSGVAGPAHGSPDHLVLDGQQRLTSLSLALRGRGEHLFFLDLKALEEEGLEAAVNHLRIDQAEKRGLLDRWIQFERHMYPLSAVFADNIDDDSWFDDYAEHHHQAHEADRNAMRSHARTLRKTYVEPLRTYEFPVVELPAGTSLEAVCTIFETLNKTGMKLTVFDLLTAKFWPQGLHLREMLSDARQTWPLLGERDFDVESTYLLQAVSLYRSQEAPKCKRGDLLELDPQGFDTDFEQVCRAASAALTMLRDECGVLGAHWMPYMTLLPSFIASVIRVQQLDGAQQASAWKKLRQWFWCCCFGQRYEGPVTSLNATDYRQLLLWFEDDSRLPEAVEAFSAEDLDLRAVRRQRNAIYRAVICLAVTHGARDFHTGQRLTADLLRDPELRIEDHHIVPTAYLKKHHGVTKAEDSILNHCLIDAVTNKKISDKAPSRYLQAIASVLGDHDSQEILASHLIPAAAMSALRREPFDLDAFLDERARLILPEVRKVTGSVLHSEQTGDAYLDPATPYSNELALQRVLGRLRGSVFWYEQHLPKKALDLLVDSLERNHVTTLRLLSGPANVTDKAKRAFERFKEELINEGITAEWRVLPPEAARDLHARVIFDEQLTYEMPPVNSVLAGTVDSIRQSNISHAPFETAWDGEGTLSLGEFVPGQATHKKRDSVPDALNLEENLGRRTAHLGGQRDLHDEKSQAARDGRGVRAHGDKNGSASGNSLKNKHRWTAEELVSSIREKRGVQAAAAAETIVAWVGDHDPPLNVYLGAGRALGSFMPGLERGGAYVYPIALFSDGSIEIQFQHMMSRPQRPFEEVSAREEMRAHLNEIPGVSISARKLDARPSFSISLLVTDSARDHFLETLDWAFSQSLNAIDEARATMPSTGSISVELSPGAVRHHYLVLRGHEAFFPADAFGGSTAQDAGNPVSLEYTGTGETVQTDLNDQMEIRARGQLRRFYQYHHLAPRDTVRLERTGDRVYRVEALKRDPTRVPLPGIVGRLDQEIGHYGGAPAPESAGRDSQAASRSSVDADTYYDELPDGISEVVRSFIEAVPRLGAELEWRHYGPRVRVRGSAGPKVVASIQGDTAYLVTGSLQGIDPQPAQRALARLKEVASASAKPGATYPGINIRKADLRDIEAFFSVASDFVREVARQGTAP